MVSRLVSSVNRSSIPDTRHLRTPRNSPNFQPKPQISEVVPSNSNNPDAAPPAPSGSSVTPIKRRRGQGCGSGNWGYKEYQAKRLMQEEILKVALQEHGQEGEEKPLDPEVDITAGMSPLQISLHKAKVREVLSSMEMQGSLGQLKDLLDAVVSKLTHHPQYQRLLEEAKRDRERQDEEAHRRKSQPEKAPRPQRITSLPSSHAGISRKPKSKSSKESIIMASSHATRPRGLSTSARRQR